MSAASKINFYAPEYQEIPYPEELYAACSLCPRRCGCNRLEGAAGFCGQTARLLLSRAALHFWEEPCISGTGGSGTVFFCGCSLGCIYCQNYEISGRESALEEAGHGKVVTKERLAEIFLELQEQGAHNINLVTGAQFLPHILWAIPAARKAGLTIPIVYNTSGYELVSSLKLLEGLVDIYLPDLKYLDAELAAEYSRAADYPQTAQAAIAEMVRQIGAPMTGADGMMQKGVIVRHLLLPGRKEAAKEIIKYLWEQFGERLWMSILRQYTPTPQVAGIRGLNRKVTTYEYEKTIDYALQLGITSGFRQEGEAAAESFIPSFRGEGV